MSSVTLTLKEMVISILKEKSGDDLKPSEIAELISQKYPDYCAQKIKNTKQPNFNLLKQISNQISAGSQDWITTSSNLKCSDNTPRTYWWEVSEETGSINDTNDNDDEAGKTPTKSEKELYNDLAIYLTSMRTSKLYPKRINESKSSNNLKKNGNKYLHPDIVVLEDLMPESLSQNQKLWSEDMKRWATTAGAPQSKLWSFEVKIKLGSVSEAREGYLQALANSAWANHSYLVATHISDHAFSELKMLHELHGIGLILLDAENPADDSIIKLPASQRDCLDWGCINRIASQNSDFRKFIELVADFHQTTKVRPYDWDMPQVEKSL